MERSPITKWEDYTHQMKLKFGAKIHGSGMENEPKETELPRRRICAQQLGYPPGHILFGQKKNNKYKDIKEWIEAMFFVGNQIPLIVLKELMKQRYLRLQQQQPSDLLHGLQLLILEPKCDEEKEEEEEEEEEKDLEGQHKLSNLQDAANIDDKTSSLATELRNVVYI
ncbi:Hypothetical predicted protein [Olea europaea subsp. europaea]|uniref:Uncharacterized protein n=1 Tax=Olea europaea subsp. europaea TaxID=158383 RepID=A0A8S0TET1_OLEEU|nr:Hypothetical predicted protein [Olea europaea subsp. europaea]